jgi:hypothetical protein
MGSGGRPSACGGMPTGDAPAVGPALRYRSNIVRLQCEPARWPRSLAFRGAKPRRSSNAGDRGLRTHGPAGNVALRKVGSPRKRRIGGIKGGCYFWPSRGIAATTRLTTVLIAAAFLSSVFTLARPMPRKTRSREPASTKSITSSILAVDSRIHLSDFGLTTSTSRLRIERSIRHALGFRFGLAISSRAGLTFCVTAEACSVS